MSRFADIRVEWRVEEIERTLQRKADSHEVSTLDSDVVRLERANGELRSEVDGLRAQLHAMREQIIRLQDQFIQLMPELTDEEIMKVSDEIERSDFFDVVIPFARAILAAAREKAK